MDNNKVIIYGNGEIAELAHFYFIHDTDYDVVAFCVDSDYQTSNTFCNLPLLCFEDLPKSHPPSEYKMHVAFSYQKLNKLREEKYTLAKYFGYELVSYISSKATTWLDLNIGDNCFILEDQTIQPYVTIGNNVMLWSGNHLGHGSSIGDHSYLSSQITVCGHATIGKRCFIGVNASIRDFIIIEDDVFIAMDASVTKNIARGSVVLSAVSTVLGAESELARKILTKEFRLGTNKESELC